MAWSLAMQTGNWSRYAELIRLCIPCNHDCLQVALLDVVPDCMPRPPESWKRRNSRGFTSVQKFHTHTLAQNCHCEFCCGMHLTCKSTSIKPDRSGLMKWPAKLQEVTITIFSDVTAAMLKMCRLQKPYRQRSDIKLVEKSWNWLKNGEVVLGLATAHHRNLAWNWNRYVDPASRIDITECQSRLRWLQNYDIPFSPLLIRNHRRNSCNRKTAS